MSRKSGHQRSHKNPKTLLSMAFSAISLGFVMVLVAYFAGSMPVLRAVATGLRIPGWLALIAGLGLLILDTVLKLRRSNNATAPWVNKGRLEPIFDVSAPTDNKSHSTPKTPTPRSEWSDQVFTDIEWRRFEAVCELLFQQAGFQTRSQSHGADGGVDIWLHSRHSEGTAAIVQCKHWHGKRVGVKELREFYGVMASHKIERGTYATTSTYSADAKQFAKANGINALDGNELLALIAKRSPEQQQDLLTVAYEGEFWRPTCASCGIKMIHRQPSNGNAAFWGCINYPRCKSILPAARAHE